MSWPAQSALANGTDWSYYNQEGQYQPPRTIPVERFCEANPSIEVFILRACWPSGSPDPLYPIYYDLLTQAGKRVAAYLWPNVLKSLDTTRENWKRALGDRVPPLLMLDFEEPSYGATSDALTYNAEQSLFLLKDTFAKTVIGYTRANWWESRINRKIELLWPWLLAHYPVAIPKPDGTFRQYATHAELAAHLPIGNTFTPYMGRRGGFTQENVVGWQFSEYMFPSPTVWSRRIDGDSIKRTFLDPIYGTVPPPSGPMPSLEDRVAKLETEARNHGWEL